MLFSIALVLKSIERESETERGFFISFYIMLHLIVSISTSAVSAFHYVRFYIHSNNGGNGGAL